MIYEIDDIGRFPQVANFISSCRLVKPAHESAGKKHGSKNSKIGNLHLKWAFSEAACLFLKGNPRAKKYHERLVSKYGKAKALTILAQKPGRTVYTILKRGNPCNCSIQTSSLGHKRISGTAEQAPRITGTTHEQALLYGANSGRPATLIPLNRGCKDSLIYKDSYHAALTAWRTMCSVSRFLRR
jgi:hypothetical protein